MKLNPYGDRDRRTRKVIKHYFNLPERWWDLDGDSFDDWHRGWNAVRVAGAFNGEEGHRAVERGSDADEECTRAHDTWLAQAEQACDRAREAGTVFFAGKRRSKYVGFPGVVVVVTASGRGSALVTAFRVAPLSARSAFGGPEPSAHVHGRALEKNRRQERARHRAAVRRAHRGTSFGIEGQGSES